MVDRTQKVDPDHVVRLQKAIAQVIRAFLVAGRAGQPAEGRLRFNPLYFHMLNLIHDQGALRPSDLASVLGVARSTISTAAEALVREGLLHKERDPNDGRAIQLVLTSDGKDTAQAIRRQDQKNAAVLLSAVSAQERELLLPLIEQAAASIAQIDTPTP